MPRRRARLAGAVRDRRKGGDRLELEWMVIFDPPFRWFPPRDLRETASTDENYQTLTAFLQHVDRYLAKGGRIVIGFGSSGDIAYLHHLIRSAEMDMETFSSWGHTKNGLEVQYYAYRLTRKS